MGAIVIPFRGDAAKQRVEAPAEARRVLALAMLADVVTAATATAPTVVVTSDQDAAELVRGLGADVVPDPGGGQAAAVGASLTRLTDELVLVVNADVPCVVPHDLRTLAGAAEAGAMGIVEAADGTTNALALPRPSAFAPLFGPGSAARFRERAGELGLDAVTLALPNLADDVDTLADLELIALRAGPRTQAAMPVVAT